MTNNTPKPKPSKKDTAKSGAIFDAVLDDDTIEQHTELEEVAEEAIEVEAEAEAELVAEVVAEEAVTAPETENEHSFVQSPPSAYAVVGANEVDDVFVSKVIYKNIYQKKSLSVHHVQRRLNERGYNKAYLDKDGFYGDLTKSAMEQFQKDNGIEGNGMPDLATLNLLFENDSNVRVMP
jgi:hypothetical protein